MNELTFLSSVEVKTGEICPETGFWIVKEIPGLEPVVFQKNEIMSSPMPGCVITWVLSRILAS